MGDTVLTVKCADGKVYKVTAKLAEFSRRLIGALNDPRNRGCDEITIILDQQVNGNIFELLLIWAQHYMVSCCFIFLFYFILQILYYKMEHGTKKNSLT